MLLRPLRLAGRGLGPVRRRRSADVERFPVRRLRVAAVEVEQVRVDEVEELAQHGLVVADLVRPRRDLVRRRLAVRLQQIGPAVVEDDVEAEDLEDALRGLRRRQLERARDDARAGLDERPGLACAETKSSTRLQCERIRMF